MSDNHAHKPGDKLQAFDRGRWIDVVVIKFASYEGKSGPGYYVSYDPALSSCSTFWTCDQYLKPRNNPQA